MKICLLVAMPDRPLLFVQQPVESLYTATILRQQGHDAYLVDARLGEDQVKLGDPDLVIVITQTYDLTQCNSISLEKSRELVAMVRQRHPGVPIVAAGVHASMEPEMTRRDLDVDASLPGELESAVPAFVARVTADPLALHGPFDDIPQQVDPQTLPVPDYDLVDVHRYWGEVVDPSGAIRNGTTGLIFANRGCPYTCSYCFVWFGAKIRRRDPEQVVAEMRAQRERGVRHFFFLDYTFTIVPTWVRELCALIRAEKLDVSWICQTRVERVNPELLADMRSAGCTGIFYGVESPWIADLDMDKPTGREAIEEAVRQTNDAGIQPLVFILFGTENGDPAKARELHDFLRDLPATFHPSVLLPRPFTSLWNKHTEGMARPTSWTEYAQVASELQREILGRSEVGAVHKEILLLPNYVENRLRVEEPVEQR
ncbi:B12-binding domain-containing radical SAM protein [Micromonospora zingiberis]|uniref:B12-binding domain-containing radical SAM protein n=1 Tax=Micromonospora zingiberis TaxID=2053011 RepID=A0A4R0GVQ9_9ACTN|nr:radical SAM protein [Micromonospora zingiberis]TCB99658.1 B12-binding domain-containing radical SAM protein [Micromonospora zingiberis]